MGTTGMSVCVHMSTHHVFLCTQECIWHFLCTQQDVFMYTRVYNRVLCTQEYKGVITDLDGLMSHKHCFKNVFSWEHKQLEYAQIYYKGET